MSRRMLIAVAVAAMTGLGFAVQAEAAPQSSAPVAADQVAPSVTRLGPAPSWQLNRGAPGTCAVSAGFGLPGVEVNIPTGSASEQGVLSAPGQPNLGFTVDPAFGPFVGPISFFVFATAPYSLPLNTPLTLSVTTYNGPNFTGGVAYVSTITWDCTTGALLGVAPVPTLSQGMLLFLGVGLLVVGVVVWSRKASGRRLGTH